MALLSLNFFSYTLGMDTTIKVFLPEKRQQAPNLEPDKKYPVLYLLHGHSDDDTSWIRKSIIELLVRERDLIVVMPNGHRSFYTNGRESHMYFDYLVHELPVVTANFFPASTKREDTCIAGISMGGYGAFKAALTYPERYFAAASLSGALYPFDVVEASKKFQMFTVPDFERQFERIFKSPEAFKTGTDNLENLLTANLFKNQPILFQCIGNQDPIYQSNQVFLNIAKEKGLKLTYEEKNGGHNWEFWNQMIPIMLNKFYKW